MFRTSWGWLILAFASGFTLADTLTDWADRTTEIATDGPNTVHNIALAENAVFEAVNAITVRYPKQRVDLGPAQGASIDAAIAAASRTVLLNGAPGLAEQIDAAYDAALHAMPDNESRMRGVNLGVRAAEDVLAKHAQDLGNPEPYRPATEPGSYVPTVFPLGVAVSQQHPWFLKSNSEIRPGPPTPLKSEAWARDYNETKTLGEASSTQRSADQTTVGRFWATALPDVHIGVIRSAALNPNRDLTRNARLYAAITAAMNDAEISVFEAKYHYNFWRPVTAIRNGDRDDNPATERDSAWIPMIVTPIQPEYPCGHCILASVIGTIIRIDGGKGIPIPLNSVSNTLPGVTRHWSKPEEVVHEVANARIWSGVHFRDSTEVGIKMGEQIGQRVAAAYQIP